MTLISVSLLSLVVPGTDVQGNVMLYTESSHPESIASAQVYGFSLDNVPRLDWPIPRS